MTRKGQEIASAKLGGAVKLRLCRELALKEVTRTALAKKYGVTSAAITLFAQRHKTIIDEMIKDIDNEFAGILIADKAKRIAEYQADVDLVNATVHGTGEGDETDRVEPVADPALLRVKHRALRQVAEEMGHLPARVNVQVTGQSVTYVVEGVDLEALG